MGNSIMGNMGNPSSPVYVSDSRASSTGYRYSVTGLAEEVNVHISTAPLAQQSHSQTKDHPGERGNSNSALVAITTMVSTFTPSVCGPPRILLYRQDHTVTTEVYVSNGKSHHLHVRRLSCSTMRQQDFRQRSQDSWQLLEDLY